MAHTLRRSRSKYGRTRRQRRKQNRTRGGGFFDDFISKFKPSTPEEKCAKAQKLAQEACSNNNVDGDIEMMPMDSSDSVNQDVALDTTTTPPPIPPNTDDIQLGDNNEGVKLDIPSGDMSTSGSSGNDDIYNSMQDGANSSMAVTSQKDMSGMSDADVLPVLPGNSVGEMGMDEKQNPNPTTLQVPQYNPQTVGFGGGAKKSRRKNKNKKQSRRRKKMSSRKNKK